ncbi:extracellular solute-binding protein [Halobiforma nitratireducens]|uniref:Extracellular solute-binding protein family 1 n=1 Tax=Halobiforma nitratireducens JCM 10879 TaxID=1227454 RepID=M0MMK2_9EURY|nr:extracellular solute-binding protein [Halobiforma nitratireducens]EMA46901.1 extracellular solute-binding protein family 1 [Halobiforma nitratireducens JCM 10879]
MADRDRRSRASSRPASEPTRRSFLSTAAAVGGVTTAGCLAGEDRISVLAAGSLAVALEERVGPAFESAVGVRFDGEYHGTNALLRMVESGRSRPDVVIGVDVSLLRERLYPDHTRWDVEFATNELGIAYAPETDLGRRLEADNDEPWYDVFADAPAGSIGITDPDQSPLGYRALQLFELAEHEHSLDGFVETMADRTVVDAREGQLLGGLEAGSRAFALVYRNMAADRELPFYRLPDAYNFSDPDRAASYERASYVTDDGHAVTGSAVVYNAAVPETAADPDGAKQFVATLLERPSLLEESGLRVPDALPRTYGEPPEVVGA